MNQNQISDAVTQYLGQQSWFLRRKDTLVAVAGGVLQIAQIATAYTAGAPEWVPILIGLVIIAAQAVVHAATPGAVTPSMGPRLEAAYSGPLVADPMIGIRESVEVPVTSTGRHHLEE